jgi:hypothetical protein
MAFGTRGAEDREAFIDYVDALDVPESWRKEEDAIVLAKALFERAQNQVKRPARRHAKRKLAQKVKNAQ